MTTRKTIAFLAAGAIGAGTLAGFSAPRSSHAEVGAADQASAASFSVDPVHSSLVFRIKHLGVSYFYGRFNQIQGTFTNEPGGSIDLTVAADSVDTNSEQRDGHLKTPDFFNVKQFPEITFTSTSVESAGDGTLDVSGELTILAKTVPVSVEVTKIGEGDRGRAGYVAGIETEMTIRRSDFGMTYGLDNGALGDEVTLYISLEGARD